ncbi:MAG TPA: energy transducer TonB [Candidatus Kapabacteria bacterium]|nr:energy transducer TonB [Candidatus Kapabacteria bacterium]
MAAVAERPTISASDRLTFTLFIAAIFHAMVILGVGFSFTEPQPAASSLEIVLAQSRSDTAPEQADFLAQANQQGSGDLDRSALPTTNELAQFEDSKIREIQPLEQSATQKQVRPDDRPVITTQGRSQQKVAIANPSPDDQKVEISKEERLAMIQRSLEIASLEAQLEEQKQTHAKRPRKRQLTSVSTKESRDAYYLHAWSKKIETVGNLNYPAEARRNKIYGSLRMMVAIRADGSVHEMRILKSSGYRVLDQAAMQIVRLAAPYSAFPPEIRQDTDILEIIRTWQFEKGGRLSSY